MYVGFLSKAWISDQCWEGKNRAFSYRCWISQPTEESIQRVCRYGKHLDFQQSTTLKTNLFINTVVYLEMCCQEGGKKEKDSPKENKNK